MELQDLRRLQEAIDENTNEQWMLMSATRYEEYWVVIAFCNGKFRDFLFYQDASNRLIHYFAEETLYFGREQVGYLDEVDRYTYVIATGPGFHEIDGHDYSKEELVAYMEQVQNIGETIEVTPFYGREAQGNGHYRKNEDGTFTAVFEDMTIAGLLEEIGLR